MRIQHNIMAMNAYRNYTNNVSAMKGNLEKLSSGYKINRAGDDAAGLAISEKMRAQITGLTQAQNNAKSAINLVQTAEGALQEVQDMLNRMVKLAEQSANGTYDDGVDRAQLQKEFTKLTEEIDRINQAANFNGKTLFGGAAGGANTADPSIALPEKDTDNGAKLTEDTGFAFDDKATDEQKAAFNKALDKGVELKVTLADKGGGTANDLEAGDKIKVEGLDGLKDYTFKLVAADGSTEIDDYDGTEIAFKASGTDAPGVGDVTINVYDKDDKKVGAITIGLDDTSGKSAEGATTVTLTAGDASKASSTKGPTFTENESGGSDKTLADFDLKALDLSNAKGIKDGDVKISYGDDDKLTIKVGEKTYVSDAISSAPSEDDKIKLYTADDADGTGDDGYVEVTVSDGTSVLNKGTAVAEAKVGTVKAEAASGGAGTFNFQVGDTNATYNKISLTIKSIGSTAITDISEGTGLTLSQLKVDTEDNAGTALSALKGMVNYISDIRGELGATQNRLTHTINNLSVMTENIQDAESTIRDTDVADEMMAYTKNNILIQSAQAMLAQANQVPQGVLQLLQ